MEVHQKVNQVVGLSNNDFKITITNVLEEPMEKEEIRNFIKI